MTLRELVWMAESRQRNEWAQTSAILALLANIHRDPKKTHVFKPADFNPFLRKPPVTITQVDIGVLKQVFIDNRQ